MKNEGPFILEWIAYHLAIGVDDFLIYTNDCTDGTDEFLDILQDRGLVQHRINPFRQMPGITHLDLSGRQGTDSNVWAISMSDVGLEAILTLANLRELRFGCTSIGIGVEGARFGTVSAMSVTPRWLERMKSLRNLQRLTLQGCDRIDDEAVAILASFPGMEEVDLKGTAVTGKGLAALRAARPKLRILHGPWDAKAANFRNN